MHKAIIFSIIAALGILAGACGGATPAPSLTPSTAALSTQTSAIPPEEPVGGNFRLLISDEENAIGDFARLLVTFEGFEIERASGGWYPGDGLLVPQTPTADLVQLQGAAALAIWEGDVEETTYIKLRLIPADPSGVRGELAPVAGAVPVSETDFDGDGVLDADDNCQFISNADQVDTDEDSIGDACSVFVKLPSGRFEWEPRDSDGEHTGFTVDGVDPINFVYDFTVVRRGPPGDHDYLVQPEIGETGPGQPYVEAKDLETEYEGAELTLQLDGEPQPGTNSTLGVTDEAGNAVAGAIVRLKAEGVLGDTDLNGLLSVEIPIGTLRLRLEAENNDDDGKWEVRFAEDGTAEIDTDNDELSIQIEGLIGAGTTVMLLVLDEQGDPVPGAQISIKIEREAGLTDDDGLLDIEIPAYAEELEIEARLDDQRGEFEIEFAVAQAQQDGDGNDQESNGVETSLTVQLVGQPLAGTEVTVVVTGADGITVFGAEIQVNDEIVGSTDADGRLNITVPQDAEELEIVASLNGVDGELEITVQ